MSDVETAVSGSQQLETVLETRFGARGRGLHEKLSSVEHQLPDALVRRIRWVATVRNCVVHEGALIEEPDRFARTLGEAKDELSSLAANPTDVRERSSGSPSERVRQAQSKSSKGLSAPVVAVAVALAGVMWFLASQKSVSGVFASASATQDAPDSEQALIEPKGSAGGATANRVIGTSLAEVARRGSADLVQARQDIDGLWSSIQASTAVNIGEPNVKDNGNGTSDVSVPLTWTLDPNPMLVTLNKYFWDASEQSIQAGKVDFTDHLGPKVPGIVVKALWNDSKHQKVPFASELLDYLAQRVVRIVVSAGPHSGTITVAAGRKCLVTCDGVGSDQFQIHTNNHDDPSTTLLSGYQQDQNPVLIRSVPNGDLGGIGHLSTSVEVVPVTPSK